MESRKPHSIVENAGGEESAVALRMDEILAENRSRNASAENDKGDSDWLL